MDPATTNPAASEVAADSSLTLASPAVDEGGELPAEHTCDGASTSPPLEWSGAPDETVTYAITMHHIPPDGDDHWYWTLWDIPTDVTSIATGATPPGEIGTNSVDGLQQYAPPCSRGPGEKIYTLTIYALSTSLDLPVPANVGRDELLEAIDGNVLDEAVLDVTYTRDGQGGQP